jgi:hypothetical protein
MDGRINASFITSGILNAGIVQTGILQAKNGTTWINLDDGTFNFGGFLSWDGQHYYIKSTSTGNNLIYNSSAIGDLEAWQVAGNVTAEHADTAVNTTTAGAMFKFYSLPTPGTLCTMAQNIRTVAGTTYSYSFKYRLTTSATMSTEFTIGAATLDISQAASDWVTLQGTFIAQAASTAITIKIQNAAFYLADLVIVEGTTTATWQQSPNELYTSGIRISQKSIDISSDDSPFAATYSNTETKYYDKNKNVIIARFSIDEALITNATIQDSLTVQRYQNPSNALVIIPEADGVFFVIND